MEVSIAVSHAVQLARAEAIAAYPITPQTHIVEHLSSLVANGELEAEFVTVESRALGHERQHRLPRPPGPAPTPPPVPRGWP